MSNETKIICLGGGIGSVNLIKGLSQYTQHLTVVISMADDGGSAGRLRRAYSIPPVGDLVSCMAALAKDDNPLLSKVLTYRFPGDRYAKDELLSGHKLGNLMMVAMRDITGDLEKAITLFQKTFAIPGTFLPATTESITITAQTNSGENVVGEETIDLGKYNWQSGIKNLTISPASAHATTGVVQAIHAADVILVGPGDLYTTLLPVLLVPEIGKAVKESTAKKIFVINIANKPFETNGYTAQSFISAIATHLGGFPFDTVLINNNHHMAIPEKYAYTYVAETTASNDQATYIKADLVDETFPLYHDSSKLAKAVIDLIPSFTS